MARKIQIQFSDPSNKTSSMTVSYISTSATSANILIFAKGLISLTDNSYISTTQIDSTKLD